MKNTPFHFCLAIALMIHCVSGSGNLMAQAGNCLDFDGTNDYVTLHALADDMAGSTHFTIEFWVKGLAANQLPQAALVGVHTPSGGNVVVIVMGSSIAQDGGVKVFDGNVGSYMITGPVIGDNNWHHIVYTRTGAIAELIVDGISAGTHNPVYSFLSSNLWTVGQEWDPGPVASDFFEGQIDGLKIYNGADLEGNYSFDQGVAGGNNAGLTTLTDASLSGNNGTLVNFALNGSTSNWVISNTPLPVELSSFSAQPDAEKRLIRLQWETATETNNAGFHIQRSTDGSVWKTLDFAAGQGTSSMPKTYQYLDLAPLAGYNYYRLLQEDFDGQLTASGVSGAWMGGVPGGLRVFPNPAGDILQVEWAGPGAKEGVLTLSDMYGRILIQSYLSDTSEAAATFDLSRVPSGMYLLTLWSDAGVSAVRVRRL